MKRALNYLPFMAALVLWEAFCVTGVIPENRLPSPLAVGAGFLELVSKGLPQGHTLAGHLWASLKRVLLGVVAAVFAAVPLGLYMGRSRRLSDLLHPFIETVRPVPPLAWVPLSILWFGIGDFSASFIIFLGAFFPVLLNTASGVLSINRRLVESSIILGAGGRDLFLKVLAPGAMPSIITGIRIAVGIGWMTLVAAEFTGVKSGYGLGHLIMTARDIQRPDQIVAGMAVIGLVGYIMDLLIKRVEARLLRWV